MADEHAKLPDIQEQEDHRNVHLKWVGIEDVVLPFALLSKESGHVLPIEGKIKLAVGLPHNYRGTHMSRFVEIIESYSRPYLGTNFVRDDSTKEKYFGGAQIKQCLRDLREDLNAHDASLSMEFTYFVSKNAPVSGYPGIVDYRCRFEGEMRDDGYEFFITVEVPFMSVCPCSKEISDYGAHNQRGIATVRIKSPEDNFIWLEDIIAIAEKSGSCEIFSLLKRVDEKWVTEHSYDNPKFVEDVARDIANGLEEASVDFYEINVRTMESIHNHQAFAYTDSDTIRKEHADSNPE